MPLIASGRVGDTAALVFALFTGLVFGWFLERGGLGNARKLAGQFYLRDMTVLKVMFSAIVTAMLGLFWLSRLGVLDGAAVRVPETFVLPQLVGGLVFGVGFVTGGLCPGTSCVAASSGRKDGLLVMLGMCAGILVFAEAFPWLRRFYDSTPMGSTTLPAMLGVPAGVLVFALTVVAIALFVVATRMERRFRGMEAQRWTGRIARFHALRGPSGLARVALLLAAGALITDVANGRTNGGGQGTAMPRTAVAADRVAALDLARWIRDGRPGLRLLDVRSVAAFEEYHIPTAASLPTADPAARPLAGGPAIVVYDESGGPDGEAERAARILTHAGHVDVRVLSGGLIAWTNEVLRPVIAADASPPERARFEETAALSRWFDGIPRVVPAGAESVKTADNGKRAVRESHLLRRQGC